MQRPEILGIDDLESILQDINEMEQAIRMLKERLNEIPTQIAAQLASDHERVTVAQYLYWMVPELSSVAISEGLLGVKVQQLKRYVGSATGTIRMIYLVNANVFSEPTKRRPTAELSWLNTNESNLIVDSTVPRQRLATWSF